MIDLADWCRERRITEVECMIPDLSGIPRGKILPTDKFLAGVARQSHRIPESLFVHAVTGGDPDIPDIVPIMDRDVLLLADPATIRPVPWYKEPTAQVICDCAYPDGRPVDIYSRAILRHVLELYAARGWRPLVSPELEFYLVAVNRDPVYPLEPPVGRNGRPETARQSFGIDAVNEFDPLFEDIYEYCEAQGLDIDTLNHEAGAAQIEINFRYGDPLDLADQVFLFKRTVRQTAMSHDIYATFMARPMQHEPGSAMHLHQSLVDVASGHNLFSTERGEDTPLFRSYLAGLQAYAPEMVLLFAPNVNSYRRIRSRRRRSTSTGGATIAAAGCACRCRSRRTAASRTASAAPTSTPTWRLRRRWPAATSAWSRGSSRPPRRPATPLRCRAVFRSTFPRHWAPLPAVNARGRSSASGSSAR